MAGCSDWRRPMISEIADYPDADGTDAAHPAWWRGNSAGVASLCQIINGILDGKDDGSGVASEPWEATRRRLLAIAVDDKERLLAKLELIAGSLATFSEKLDDSPMSAQSHLDEAIKVAAPFAPNGERYSAAAAKERRANK